MVQPVVPERGRRARSLRASGHVLGRREVVVLPRVPVPGLAHILGEGEPRHVQLCVGANAQEHGVGDNGLPDHRRLRQRDRDLNGRRTRANAGAHGKWHVTGRNDAHGRGRHRAHRPPDAPEGREQQARSQEGAVHDPESVAHHGKTQGEKAGRPARAAEVRPADREGGGSDRRDVDAAECQGDVSREDGKGTPLRQVASKADALAALRSKLSLRRCCYTINIF
mmetsp:Transcript_14361/g.38074  ORF Transcript_14361/g.38074 Transcript_14361/m.38074 type:complete len:224 (-) Transcript_14361:40-711(-)